MRDRGSNVRKRRVCDAELEVRFLQNHGAESHGVLARNRFRALPLREKAVLTNRDKEPHALVLLEVLEGGGAVRLHQVLERKLPMRSKRDLNI